MAFYAASVDPIETNTKFAQSLDLDYPVLSDSDKRVAEAYGVLAGGRSAAARWTFYIGKDGKILYIDKQVTPNTAGDAVAERLASLGIPKR